LFKQTAQNCFFQQKARQTAQNCFFAETKQFFFCFFDKTKLLKTAFSKKAGPENCFLDRRNSESKPEILDRKKQFFPALFSKKLLKAASSKKTGPGNCCSKRRRF